MPNRITVHVTSKDRSSELAVLLRSLRGQTYKHWDLMLLDDAFGTPVFNNFKFMHDQIARLKIEGHGVHIMRNNISYGICKARQKLVDEEMWKDNPYILRLDDDQDLEPDYIERLVKILDEDPKIGLASGITPLLQGPDQPRPIEHLRPETGRKKNEKGEEVIEYYQGPLTVNMILLDDQGNIKYYGDDCGFLWDEKKAFPAHQFRSSALIRREIFDKGIKYQDGLTNTGFREEAYLSLKILMLDYKIMVDTGAIAWHAPCGSGGCRSQDYEARVALDQDTFTRWIKANKDKLAEVLK